MGDFFMENFNHTFCLDSRKSGKITNVLEVKTFLENEIKLKLKDGVFLTVLGNNLKIISFDNSTGVLSFVGVINSIKYQEKSQNLIKKVFK